VAQVDELVDLMKTVEIAPREASLMEKEEGLLEMFKNTSIGVENEDVGESREISFETVRAYASGLVEGIKLQGRLEKLGCDECDEEKKKDLMELALA